MNGRRRLLPRLRVTLALSLLVLLLSVGATALLSSVQRLNDAVTLDAGSRAARHVPPPRRARAVHRAPRRAESQVEAPPQEIAEPKPIFSPPPRYPIKALRAQRGGLVQVRVTLDAGGGVTQAQIEHSSGDPDLDQAALAAARRWKFAMQPQTRRVAVLPIRFRIDPRTR